MKVFCALEENSSHVSDSGALQIDAPNTTAAVLSAGGFSIDFRASNESTPCLVAAANFPSNSFSHFRFSDEISLIRRRRSCLSGVFGRREKSTEGENRRIWMVFLLIIFFPAVILAFQAIPRERQRILNPEKKHQLHLSPTSSCYF